MLINIFVFKIFNFINKNKNIFINGFHIYLASFTIINEKSVYILINTTNEQKIEREDCFIIMLSFIQKQILIIFKEKTYLGTKKQVDTFYNIAIHRIKVNTCLKGNFQAQIEVFYIFHMILIC
ncbi:hypothetical protein RFI_32989 [Reticulomyxa filosa]|uniref:Uncharacterized protein n=1 Tax=Reticulomyxa filosa TaxID=46433 RepID=X6LST0_RETFI|nr:hypothetical protein RFI_32989 [Reticulomyxa filosa]|eukprot:ETO04406.1 hypothetical protein RFI_32989 [Reticulomyxa filosa]